MLSESHEARTDLSANTDKKIKVLCRYSAQFYLANQHVTSESR
jgi:hypothetical protein